MSAQLKLPIEPPSPATLSAARKPLTAQPLRSAPLKSAPMPVAEREPSLADLLGLNPLRWLAAAASFAAVAVVIAGLVQILWSL